MKTKLLKKLLIALGTAALLAGCATGRGGMGNNEDMIPNTAPNGSINPGNPLGLGTGTGMTR